MSQTTTPTPEAAVQPSASTNATNNAIAFGAKPTTEQIKTIVQQAVDAALASPLFTGNLKVVNKALEALAIPDPYARFRKQFKDVALRNLLAKAPVVNGQVAYPSNEALAAELERLIDELKAKHDKERKNNH